MQSLPLLVDKWTSHDNQLMQAKKMGTVKRMPMLNSKLVNIFG